MTILVILPNVIIIIFPIPCTGIIRRINVDTVRSASICEQQGLKSVIVLPVNDHLVRSVTTTFNATNLPQACVYRLFERSNCH